MRRVASARSPANGPAASKRGERPGHVAAVEPQPALEREPVRGAVGAQHLARAVQLAGLHVAPHQNAPQLGPLAGTEARRQLLEPPAGFVQLALAGEHGHQRGGGAGREVAGVRPGSPSSARSRCVASRSPAALVGLRCLQPRAGSGRIGGAIAGDELEGPSLRAEGLRRAGRAELIDQAVQPRQGLRLVIG